MKKAFTVGDHVGWNSEAGHVRETIIKKITSAMTFKGYTVRASKERTAGDDDWSFHAHAR